jgi:hypothetical protein
MTTPPPGGVRHDGDDDNFVIVPRPTIRDDRLSFRARGLLTFLLDLPEGWDIRASWLAKQGKEGEEAVYTALRELRTFGYYRVELRKGEGGRWISGTAIRKRPSPLWAAQYAVELEARAAKRKVSLPVYAPGEDEVPVTVGDDMTPLADSDFSGNRESRDGSSGNRVPPTPKEERGRRSEKGTSLPTGEGAHARTHADAHTREAHDEHPQLALVGAPAEPVKGKRARRTPTQIPEDWEPSEKMRKWTREEVPGIPRVEVEYFRSHHRDNHAMKADWDAAWRTWARNWVRFGSKGSTLGGSRPGKGQAYRNPVEEPTQESLVAGWAATGTSASASVRGGW